jgi:hypothetical protein
MRAQSLGLEVRADADLVLLAQARAAKLARRMRHAATARLFGHRLDRCFAPARIAPSQLVAIEKLGYAARRLDRGVA